jgi:hypothetical protein
MTRRFKAVIDPSSRIDDIERVEICGDEAVSGGAFLFLYRALEAECASDEWYEGLEEAKSIAAARWNIDEADWIVVE